MMGGALSEEEFLFAATSVEGKTLGLTSHAIELWDSQRQICKVLLVDIKDSRYLKSIPSLTHRLVLALSSDEDVEFVLERGSHVKTFLKLISYHQKHLQSLHLHLIPPEAADLHLPSPSWVIPFTELKRMDSIGSGAYSTISKAQWQGQTVAVKRIYFYSDPEDRLAIRREIECLM